MQSIKNWKPQKENVYNGLLPYADKLEEESQKLYLDIKTNLIKAVLAREIRPGCLLWTSRLHKYMRIYGLKFSKEDHIGLVKLYYELITIPGLEPTRIGKFSSTLTYLLKKRNLLSREDLQLEWRPLYEMVKRVTKKRRNGTGLYRYISTLEGTIDKLIKNARIYFPASATQEILDEFRPLLCPYNPYEFTRSLNYLTWFLPVVVDPSEAAISYELWFKEFMDLWERCHNSNLWDNCMTWLMTYLCQENIGYIDWEPYVPIMFSRFLRTLQLPVGYKQKQSMKYFKIDVSAITEWIVSTLGGPTDTVFVHLENFMQVLESYFHTANTGRWSPRIRDFLKKISCNFVTRIHNERFREKTWEHEIPESHRLSDEDIDRFINILKPCLEHTIYSRHQDVVHTFNYLASIRPNLIVPMLIDKLYLSMDSLTEPHKLTSAMLYVSSVSRYMVQGKKVNYPEGPTHVVPLLMNLLPGIDANDIRKCYMTFNFILQFVNVMPLINSSEANLYYDDLTEEEHIVCEATANFEDFILQFFDRLCIWVESNSLEMTRMEQNDNDRKISRAENQAEGALVSVISAVLTQCSPEIFTAALKKMYNFATNRIFEVRVSGKMVGSICQAFGRINPIETAKLFIPQLCDTIETLLASEDILKEETLDEELLYNLLLLSEVLDLNTELVGYMDRLMKILDKALFLTSLQGSTFGAHMLSLIMASLSFTQPIDYRSLNTSYDKPIKEFLSIRHWGEPANIHKLDVKWYTPGEKEVACVQMLLHHYLLPQLAVLDQYARGEITLSRDKLRQVFRIVLASLGCHTLLPLWDEPALNQVNSVTDPWVFELIIGGDFTVNMPDGSNVRKAVIDTVHRVQKKILEVDEGDTKSIYYIISIYEVLLFNSKFRGRDFEFHWKHFHTSKSFSEDKLHKNKRHLRHTLIDRVMLHQECRNASRSCSFTETHKQILLDLFELSTSHYGQTRSKAQAKLFSAISAFPYSYIVLKEKIIEILKMDPTVNHDKFKGCLYVLLGQKPSPIISKHDFGFIADVWPVLLSSKPSEKLSIVNLIDTLIDSVHNFFPTISLHQDIPEKTLQPALDLCRNEPKIQFENCETLISNGLVNTDIDNKRRLNSYTNMLHVMLETIEGGNLHWRYYLLGVSYLRDLIHPDFHFSPNIVRFFLKSLIHDSLLIRKISTHVVVNILAQNRRKFCKQPLPYDISKVDVDAGIRPDNIWMLYNSKTAPKNEEEWGSPRYVHNCHTGFYRWPKEVLVYDDVKSVLKMDEISDQQKEIYAFFSDEKNVELLIKYHCIEEKKGIDKFSTYRFLLFKNLFKIFEDKLLHVFEPFMDNLVNDKQEQSQRCLAELMGGLISACKHWNYKQVEDLQKKILPILKIALNNLAEETLHDWGNAISSGLENRDPNRYHWLYEFLMDNPLNEQTSYIGGARIYILQNALIQQPWRNLELMNRLLEYLYGHLTHSFQYIRDKISLCLAHLFVKDSFPVEGAECLNTINFLAHVSPNLKQLYDDSLKKLTSNRNNVVVNQMGDNNEKDDLIKLFKIVSKYVTISIVRTSFSTVPEYYQLLPLACIYQNNDSDEELVTVCTNLIVTFANAQILDKHVPRILCAIKEISQCPFWSARAVIAEFLPSFVFHNLHVLICNKEWVEEILTISLKLLEDVNPDVREKACDIISGFLHCNFIRNPENLMTVFRKKANLKLKKQEKNIHSNGIITRHAGVLGLCSFIKSHPYDVPDFMPSIFEILGAHLNDPQPIPATIRKTLNDFKRTHHTNWEDHKLKFTENELLVLNDLSVPPSYYA